MHLSEHTKTSSPRFPLHKTSLNVVLQSRPPAYASGCHFLTGSVEKMNCPMFGCTEMKEIWWWGGANFERHTDTPPKLLQRIQKFMSLTSHRYLWLQLEKRSDMYKHRQTENKHTYLPGTQMTTCFDWKRSVLEGLNFKK